MNYSYGNAFQAGKSLRLLNTGGDASNLLEEFDRAFLSVCISEHKASNTYTAIATIPNDYCMVLGKICIRNTKSSNGATLTHVRFESFDEHDRKMIETRMRVVGLRELERNFIAVENAMIKAGIEFNSVPPCHFLDLLKGLGAFYHAANPDIQSYAVMSQIRH